ncbi:hypothetical protein VTL71DRAFT_14201 [Oculimacula yallundae]|uniref:Uncharacterized protein n=1 Tax=Oculimacula yallundae TaxID=86028 RepID=A0ABR4CIH9_9HELO
MRIVSLVALGSFALTWPAQPVNAQALGAIFHGKGTGVFVHNPEAQNFLYSLSLNSENTFLDFQAVEVQAKPSNNTAVAVTGYGTTPSVWCAMASGTCVNYGEYLISKNVTVPVANNTMLAASLYLKDIGYRVTYEDITGSLRQLTYANDTKTGVQNWNDGAKIDNFTVQHGYALATTYASPTNISALRESLYVVGDQGITSLEATIDNVNVTNSIHDKKTWSVGIPIPILSLLNFVPGVTHLATIDYHKSLVNFLNYFQEETVTKSLLRRWQMGFYVDNNSTLQLIRDQDGKNWFPEPQQNKTCWPKAVSPNAPIAAVASRNISDKSAYVYYRSGQSIVQAHIVDQDWQAAIRIHGLPPTPQQAQQHEFERRVRIGAGSGVSAAVVVIITLTTFALHQRKIRARKAKARNIKKQDSIYGFDDSVPGENRFKAELNGEPAQIMELDHDPECLLLHQLQARRLVELRGGIPREIDGEEMGRGELNVDNQVREMYAGPFTCTCELDGRVIYEMECPLPELSGVEGDMKSPTILKEGEIKVESIGGVKDQAILDEKEVEIESLEGLKDEAMIHEEIGKTNSTIVLENETTKEDELPEVMEQRKCRDKDTQVEKGEL